MTREKVKKYLMNMHEAINALEKELCEDISEDGTLTVNVEDGTKVSRVFVCGDNHFGGLYYPEWETSDDHADAISKQAAIDIFIKTTSGIRGDGLKALYDLPSITPAKNVDVDRPNVYTEDEVIAMLTELQQKIENNVLADNPNTLLPFLQARETCVAVIQQKINEVKE